MKRGSSPVYSLFKSIEWLSVRLGFVAYASLIILIAVTFYEIIARYLFQSPTIWSLETGLLAQVVFVAMSGAYVLKEEGHVSVELITERLTVRARNTVLFLTSMISALLYGFMAYQLLNTGLFALRVMKRTTTLGLLLFPFQFLLALGLAVFALQFIARSYKYYQLAAKKELAEVKSGP